MLDITIDDGWLDPLVKFAAQCRSSEGGQAVHLADIRGLAGTPAIESYSPPALPSVVQVQALQISQLRFSLWSSLKLRSMDFLPSYVRRALTALLGKCVRRSSGGSLAGVRRCCGSPKGVVVSDRVCRVAARWRGERHADRHYACNPEACEPPFGKTAGRSPSGRSGRVSALARPCDHMPDPRKSCKRLPPHASSKPRCSPWATS